MTDSNMTSASLTNSSIKEIDPLQLLELLTQKCDEWTRGESSSLPAEKAQDILTSIIYVINLARIERPDNSPVSELFERGLVCVQKKLFSCHMLQRRILKNLFNTPNVFYRSTIAGGISGFFKLYSPQFSAHEIHITADYPVCMGRPELEGVEFIEEYLSRIDAENAFCILFDSLAVHRLLLCLLPDYWRLPVNIFEPVLLSALALIIVGRLPSGLDLTKYDILLLENIFCGKTKEQIESALSTALDRLTVYLDVPERSLAYASACLPALAANITNAAEHNTLDKVFLVPKAVT
ncbi:MAG: DUF6179 domain-containing protein [Anaerovoracaceae bacterium]